MQVHVVQPGQTFSGIAAAYGISLNQLLSANQVPNPDRPVPGQAVVIPITGRYHWVQPGESLWRIAQLYGIPLQRLLEVNQIPDPRRIQPGLRLYIPPGPRPTIIANAYFEPRGQEPERASVAEVAPYLTYVAMFSFRVRSDGGLEPLPDQQAREGARSGAAQPLMVITNIRDDAFSAELAAEILTNPDRQERLLTNAIEIMRERGYTGLNVDFEHLRPEDRVRYNRFLARAAQRLRPLGYTLSTAVAPKVSATQVGTWYEAHDYPAHGEVADFVIPMTYEWGWSGGPPRAVAPLNEVRRVITYAVSAMPANKVVMGIPLYGYDWTLPYVPGGPFARVVSPQQAIELAARYGVSIQYDPQSQAPWFRYRDEQGREHEVWFEDARSIEAKFGLVREQGLGGVSYWRLPISFPQNWLLLQDRFQVQKR